MITEVDLVGRSEEFQAALKAEDRTAVAEYCIRKAAGAPQEEAETWDFMSLLFQEDSRR